MQSQDDDRVTVMEHVTTLVATLDRRFDSMHQDLKDLIAQRFTDSDLRYQQRFDAQTKALDAALAAQKEAVQTALVAAEKANTKAELSADKRFDSVNEFRQTLTDQATTFIPRTEAEARIAALSEKLDDLKTYQAASIGRDAVTVPGNTTLIRELADQVRALHDERASRTGRAAGLNQGWVYLIGAAGFFATLIAIFFALSGA